MKRLKGGPFLQLLVEHYTSLQKGEKVPTNLLILSKFYFLNHA